MKKTKLSLTPNQRLNLIQKKKEKKNLKERRRENQTLQRIFYFLLKIQVLQRWSRYCRLWKFQFENSSGNSYTSTHFEETNKSDSCTEAPNSSSTTKTACLCTPSPNSSFDTIALVRNFVSFHNFYSPNLNPQTLERLMRDLREIREDPLSTISALPLEGNILVYLFDFYSVLTLIVGMETYVLILDLMLVSPFTSSCNFQATIPQIPQIYFYLHLSPTPMYLEGGFVLICCVRT